MKMNLSIQSARQSGWQRYVCALLVLSLFVTMVLSPAALYAAETGSPAVTLPRPGTLLPRSHIFSPAMIRGLTVYPDNPLQLDFIVDPGEQDLDAAAFEAEAQRQIKYFLAALTVPEDDLWVNLSPYEGERIIPAGLGTTEMGRDMLAQDYLLKQLTASLLYPEEDLGQKFWQRVYARAQGEYGLAEIPVSTFNKVWVVPDAAAVYEHAGSVFVVERHLKVMLDADYRAAADAAVPGQPPAGPDAAGELAAQVVREVILPEIEQEVNEGATFARLRQIYNSLILAAWYKKRLRQGLLGQVYVDRNKTRGIDLRDPQQVRDAIYTQYLEAFRQGVYNYIREDLDPTTGAVVPRKYFSGGLQVGAARVDELRIYTDAEDLPKAMSSAIGQGRQGTKTVTTALVENQSEGTADTFGFLGPVAVSASSPINLSGFFPAVNREGRIKKLLPRLGYEDPAQRDQAVEDLLKLGATDQHFIAGYSAVMRDSDRSLSARQEAVKKLGELWALDPLIEALSDPGLRETVIEQFLDMADLDLLNVMMPASDQDKLVYAARFMERILDHNGRKQEFYFRAAFPDRPYPHPLTAEDIVRLIALDQRYAKVADQALTLLGATLDQRDAFNRVIVADHSDPDMVLSAVKKLSHLGPAVILDLVLSRVRADADFDFGGTFKDYLPLVFDDKDEFVDLGIERLSQRPGEREQTFLRRMVLASGNAEQIARLTPRPSGQDPVPASRVQAPVISPRIKPVADNGTDDILPDSDLVPVSSAVGTAIPPIPAYQPLSGALDFPSAVSILSSSPIDIEGLRQTLQMVDQTWHMVSLLRHVPWAMLQDALLEGGMPASVINLIFEYGDLTLLFYLLSKWWHFKGEGEEAVQDTDAAREIRSDGYLQSFIRKALASPWRDSWETFFLKVGVAPQALADTYIAILDDAVHGRIELSPDEKAERLWRLTDLGLSKNYLRDTVGPVARDYLLLPLDQDVPLREVALGILKDDLCQGVESRDEILALARRLEGDIPSGKSYTVEQKVAEYFPVAWHKTKKGQPFKFVYIEAREARRIKSKRGEPGSEIRVGEAAESDTVEMVDVDSEQRPRPEERGPGASSSPVLSPPVAYQPLVGAFEGDPALSMSSPIEVVGLWETFSLLGSLDEVLLRYLVSQGQGALYSLGHLSSGELGNILLLGGGLGLGVWLTRRAAARADRLRGESQDRQAAMAEEFAVLFQEPVSSKKVPDKLDVYSDNLRNPLLPEMVRADMLWLVASYDEALREPLAWEALFSESLLLRVAAIKVLKTYCLNSGNEEIQAALRVIGRLADFVPEGKVYWLDLKVAERFPTAWKITQAGRSFRIQYQVARDAIPRFEFQPDPDSPEKKTRGMIGRESAVEEDAFVVYADEEVTDVRDVSAWLPEEMIAFFGRSVLAQARAKTEAIINASTEQDRLRLWSEYKTAGLPEVLFFRWAEDRLYDGVKEHQRQEVLQALALILPTSAAARDVVRRFVLFSGGIEDNRQRALESLRRYRGLDPHFDMFWRAVDDLGGQLSELGPVLATQVFWRLLPAAYSAVRKGVPFAVLLSSQRAAIYVREGKTFVPSVAPEAERYMIQVRPGLTDGPLTSSPLAAPAASLRGAMAEGWTVAQGQVTRLAEADTGIVSSPLVPDWAMPAVGAAAVMAGGRGLAALWRRYTVRGNIQRLEGDYPLRQRLAAIDFLAWSQDERARRPLLDLLGDGSDQIRRAARSALDRLGLGEERLARGYLQALRSLSREAKAEARAALKGLPEEHGYQLLEKALLQGPNDSSWVTVVDLLVELGDARAVVPLARVLFFSESPRQRYVAGQAIQRLGTPAQVYEAYLRALKESSSTRVRALAAREMGQFREAEGFPVLDDLLDSLSDRAPVRAAVIDTILRLFGYSPASAANEHAKLEWISDALRAVTQQRKRYADVVLYNFYFKAAFPEQSFLDGFIAQAGFGSRIQNKRISFPTDAWRRRQDAQVIINLLSREARFPEFAEQAFLLLSPTKEQTIDFYKEVLVNTNQDDAIDNALTELELAGVSQSEIEALIQRRNRSGVLTRKGMLRQADLPAVGQGVVESKKSAARPGEDLNSDFLPGSFPGLSEAVSSPIPGLEAVAQYVPLVGAVADGGLSVAHGAVVDVAGLATSGEGVWLGAVAVLGIFFYKKFYKDWWWNWTDSGNFLRLLESELGGPEVPEWVQYFWMFPSADPRIVNCLLPFVRSPNAEVREKVVNSLERSRVEGIDDLLNTELAWALVDDSPEIRAFAALQMGRRPAEQFEMPLIYVSMNPHEPVSVRDAAVEALMRFSTPDAQRVREVVLRLRRFFNGHQQDIHRREFFAALSAAWTILNRGQDFELGDNPWGVTFGVDKHGERTDALVADGSPVRVRAVPRDRGDLQAIAADTTETVSAPVSDDMDRVGGVDFRMRQLDLQIRRDDDGVPLPLPQQPVGEMRIEGFLPVIINIAPANVPLLLGLAETGDRATDEAARPDAPAAADRPRHRADPADHRQRLLSALN